MHDPMDHAAESGTLASAPRRIRAPHDPRALRAVVATTQPMPGADDPLADEHAEDPAPARGKDRSTAAGNLSIDGFVVPLSLDPRIASLTSQVQQPPTLPSRGSSRFIGLSRFAVLVGVVALLTVAVLTSRISGFANISERGGEPRTALAALSSAPPSAAPCEDLSAFTEERGLVDVVLSNPCRKGVAARIEAEGLTLRAMFDDDGHARVLVPLFHSEADIRWQAADETMQNKHVRFAGFRDALRVAVIWHDPVDLDLHIVEPGATFGAPRGHLSPDRLTSGLGVMHVNRRAEPTGDRIEVYDLPPERNPHEGLFKVYVDVAAPDTATRSAGCGDLAGPEFQLLVLRYGDVDNQNLGFKKTACAPTRAGRHPIKFRDVNAAPPG
jgi:hypothetical protein